MLCEMQSVSSRIWTRVAVSISYNDNHYTTGTSTHSLMSSSHLFYLFLCLSPGTVHCRIVFARPSDLITCPYHTIMLFYTMLNRLSCDFLFFSDLLIYDVVSMRHSRSYSNISSQGLQCISGGQQWGSRIQTFRLMSQVCTWIWILILGNVFILPYTFKFCLLTGQIWPE